MNREDFQEKLSKLGGVAGKKQNRLTVEEVKDFFAGMELTEEQYELIFAYLASSQVTVEGYVPAENSEEEGPKPVPLTAEEENFLRSYRRDLEQLEPLEEAEILELCRQVEETGDEFAKARLTEQLLPEVLKLADGFRGREIQLGDLVQEGNIGLMLGMETLGMRGPECSPLEYLQKEICHAMAQALEDNRSEKEAGKLLAGRLNNLRDEIKKLTDELEREISVEELAVYLDMPAEEIVDLLKLAGEGTGDRAEAPSKGEE